MVIRNTQQSWMCPVRVSMSAASMVYKINTGKIQTLCTFAQMCHYSWRLQQLVKKWHNKAALPNNKYISNINGLPNQLNPGDIYITQILMHTLHYQGDYFPEPINQ